ncbi:MAG: InlB B-repeat-containing protein, partial [Tissierellia bacterium]|nr:InlB B-repeat-containing protein [Tissierellia bacterium]
MRNKKYISILLCMVLLLTNISVFADMETDIIPENNVVVEDDESTDTTDEDNDETIPNNELEEIDNVEVKEEDDDSEKPLTKNGEMTRELMADESKATIIDSKEELLKFLNKQEKKVGENSIVGGEYIINGRIEINSSELPDKPLNVYGSKITGKNAEIVITNNGKAPRGIFGTIQNNEKGNPVTEVGFSYISDISFIFDGDVEKYTFAENLHGKVFEGLDKASTINNINITVNGNILADETEKWINISGFVIDCYGFDLNGINVYVTGNIGVDRNVGSLVGVQGLFTDSKSDYPPTRLSNSSVKVDGKMIAKSQWALVGGLTVNDNPVIANNVSSDIGSIEVESTGNTNNYNYSGASVGFLNNHGKSILLDSGYANINITINPWNENDIGIELRSGFSRSNNEIPVDIGPSFDSPMEGIKNREEVKFPRVDNGVFKTDSITVESVANARVAGAAYYMAGTNNQVNIGSIQASGAKDSVIAGYGGYNNDGDNINIDIEKITFNQSGSGTTLGVFGSTVNDYGTENSSVNIGNITGENTASIPSYSYVAGWSNTSTLGNNNIIKLGDIEVDGVGNNRISGYTRNIKVGKSNNPKIENCNVILGNVVAENGIEMNSFTGFVQNAPETSGEINNCKAFMRNITLTGGDDTQPMLSFGGFAGENKGKITKSSSIIDGDIDLKRGLNTMNFGGFTTENIGEISNSSIQILGDIKVDNANLSNFTLAGFSGEEKGKLLNNTALIFGNMEIGNIETLIQYKIPIGLFASLVNNAELNNNAIYVGDLGNNENSVFKEQQSSHFIGNGSANTTLQQNTILLEKATKIDKSKFLPNSFMGTSNGEYYVEVDEGNRTAYPYENNELKMTEDDILGNIVITARDFQDTYWNKDLKTEQRYEDFKYVLKNEKNIDLTNYGPNTEISSTPFTIGYLSNIYDRHMAIMNDGITYDIFGIKGRTIFTVEYDGNGADSGSVKDETDYKENDTVTVKDKGNLERANYKFLGWSTNSSAKIAEYKAGDTFSITADNILYA